MGDRMYAVLEFFSLEEREPEDRQIVLVAGPGIVDLEDKPTITEAIYYGEESSNVGPWFRGYHGRYLDKDVVQWWASLPEGLSEYKAALVKIHSL